jgi:hypothetical protein
VGAMRCGVRDPLIADVAASIQHARLTPPNVATATD